MNKTTSMFASATAFFFLVFAVVVLTELSKKIHNDRISGLRGNGSGSLPTNATNHSLCLVSVLNFNIDRAEAASAVDSDERLICSPVSGLYGDSYVSDSFFYLENINQEDVQSNRDALKQNQWFIEYSKDWVQDSRIALPVQDNVTTIDPSDLPYHESILPHHRRHLLPGLENRRRRLTGARGERSVVIVVVNLNVDNSDVMKYAYGKNNSFASQMRDCSQEELSIVPHEVMPIVTVSPKKSIDQYTFVDLYLEVLDEVKSKLGVPDGLSVTSTTDHLMFVVPDSIGRQPGELGWGSTPGFFFGIIESLLPSSMTMLHESGHNFGLGHAAENLILYQDQSTVMGYSHRNVVRMCYNGQNMWYMNWFPDRRYTIRDLDESQPNLETVDLAFYGDYKKTNTLQPVVIRYRDVYLTYNRQIGLNSETKEYPNKMLVVREIDGADHPYTNLETALDVGSEPYELTRNNSQTNVFIEVCDKISGSNTKPESLIVAIGKDPGGCAMRNRPYISSAVAASTASSSCRNSAESVQLANTATGLPEMWDCSALDYYPANARQLVCGEIDVPSNSQVWEICRLQCPQTSCLAS